MTSKSKLVFENASRFSKWNVGERVLCRYPKGEIFYEAKIIGVSVKESNDFVYKVHYQGWNSRYDEKITEEDAKLRFRLFTEQDAEKAKEEIKQALQQKKGRKSSLKKSPIVLKLQDAPETEASISSLPSTIAVGTLSKKFKKNSDIKRHSQVKKANEFYEQQKKKQKDSKPGTDSCNSFEPVELTPELGNILKLDHYLIKDQFFLPILPTSVTIFQIIDKYRKHLEKEAFDELENLNDSDELPLFVNEELECNIEFVLGIVDYFDASLAKQLLYDFEHHRHLTYFDAINKEIPEKALNKLLFAKSAFDVGSDDPTSNLRMSRHYGLAHLLRLLIKFPEMLSAMLPCNERTVKLVKQRLDRLMKFLHDNWSTFYSGQDDYKPASLQYMSRMESFRKMMKIKDNVVMQSEGENKENFFQNFVLKN